jgi:hypothetical protein
MGSWVGLSLVNIQTTKSGNLHKHHFHFDVLFFVEAQLMMHTLCLSGAPPLW